MGRATALTPDVQRRIIDAVETGMYYEQAARYGGVDPGTFRRWMEKGAEADEDEPDLDSMPAKTLRALAAQHDIPVARYAKRPAMIAALQTAGVGSWALYRAFRAAILEADVKAEATMVAQWRLLMPANHHAIKDFLSRRYPERWADKSRVQLTGAGGGPIQIDVSDERAIAETVKAYLQGTADAAATAGERDAPATMG